MKFSNGCWLQKEGCECFNPKEVYFVNIEETKVRLVCPTISINHRGDTLGCINLTMEITSPMPEVFRIRTYHHKASVKKSPSFVLETEQEITFDTKETEQEIELTSGKMRLVIGRKPFKMTFYRGDEKITASTEKDLALMKTDWRGLPYDGADDTDTYMRQMLTLSVGETVYGMGERFTPFVKNGQSVEIWNEDGGTSTQQSYKNIPFYITSKGYGVFVNHPEKVSYEVATENVTKTQFSVAGGYLDYFIINGPSMKEVLMRYTDITGKPSLPAPWTFGLWLSTSFTTDYDEKTVMSFIDGMLERGIGLRTFHFDCFWMKEFHWTGLTWDEDVFPDPEGLIRRIKEKGLNVCVWINPYIAQESELFGEGVEKGYFVKRKDGSVWQWDMWQPGMALVDFTNPNACEWYQNKLENLLDMGVDAFKTDFGERIPVEDISYFDGSQPEKMHNLYSYLYNRCVFSLLERKRGKGEAILFARSATAGGQKFPVHWGGDCWSDYESMEESLRGGLSLLMSGFGYWAHDIGGFESTSTADVYKRWVAFGLLSSHSRLHGSSSYRVPWLYDEEAVDVVRTFTALKAKLMPYLYKSAVDTSRTGVPMMRSMIMEFTEDKNCPYLDKQYMLGDCLLVAPVFREDSIASYYLPKGSWTNYFTKEERKGGSWQEEIISYLEVPLWVKENSIVVFGACESKPDYAYEENPEIRVYGLQDGAVVRTEIYGMDGNKKGTVTVARTQNEITLEVKGLQKYDVCFVNMPIAGEGAVETNGDGYLTLAGDWNKKYTII